MATKEVIIWGSSKFPRFSSFRFWPLYWNRKLGKLGNFLKASKFKWNCFVWGSWNFQGFRVFDFSPYTKIENLENSEIFSRLVNFKGFVLFEVIGNFRGLRIFDFGPYTEIEISKNSEIFSGLVNFKGLFYLRKQEISEVSMFLILALTLKSKLGKLGNIFKTCKFQRKSFTWGSRKFRRFPSFRFWPLYWNRKLGKLENIVLSEFALFEEVRNFKVTEFSIVLVL